MGAGTPMDRRDDPRAAAGSPRPGRAAVRHGAPGGRPGRSSLAGVGAAMLLLGAVAWTGCAVTPGNYKLLSTLFDGVPDPSIVPGSIGIGPGAGPAFVVLHQPYAEENCEACHRSRYRPSRADSRICLECHADVPAQHALTHGPVAATACMWCHNPHESAHPALLRDRDRVVCGQCHTPGLLGIDRVPAHADEGRACLECHTGHGGSSRFMLRPGVPTPGAPPAPTPGGPPAEAR